MPLKKDLNDLKNVYTREQNNLSQFTSRINNEMDFKCRLQETPYFIWKTENIWILQCE